MRREGAEAVPPPTHSLWKNKRLFAYANALPLEKQTLFCLCIRIAYEGTKLFCYACEWLLLFQNILQCEIVLSEGEIIGLALGEHLEQDGALCVYI